MTGGPTPAEYDAWNARKQAVQNTTPPPYFKEREVWWCALGVNVGHEEDGKGADFSRPVLIVRKFGTLFYGVPLSTTSRRGPFYQPFTYKPERGESVALLYHLRALDSRRLIRKDGMASIEDFKAVRAALFALL
jgi:mRNA interferase MazF